MNQKHLLIPTFGNLDEMEMEAVCDYLEQEAEKHSIDCRNWASQFPYHPVTVFTIALSRKYIYVDFFVRGNYLRAVNYINNSPVADDSCVEFFLKVPGSHRSLVDTRRPRWLVVFKQTKRQTRRIC